MIYPDIRKNMRADLANARVACKKIVAIMDMPLKDTIDVIMNEFCDNFPKELDFTNELRFLQKFRGICEKRKLPVVAPAPFVHLSSPEILTLELLKGKTISSLADAAKRDEGLRKRAYKAVGDVARAVGETMFTEKFFHADTHPGNLMLLDDGSAGLIDFGQCVEVSDDHLRILCHIVVLLRTRNKMLIAQALAADPTFTFNTDDTSLQLALLHYFFDTSPSGGGIVEPEALKTLQEALLHNPKAMPVLTNVPNVRGARVDPRRRGLSVAATRLHGQITSRPRRRRDPSPLIDPRRGRGVAAIRL